MIMPHLVYIELGIGSHLCLYCLTVVTAYLLTFNSTYYVNTFFPKAPTVKIKMMKRLF